MARSSLHSRASLLAACLLLSLTATSHGYLGGESGAYLRAPVGGVAFGMGGANTASPSYLASWWNPAMLGVYRSRTASLGMGVRSLGRMEGFGSFSFRIPTRVGLGVTALYRGDPFIDDIYDENGDPVDADGAFTTLSLRVGLSYRISKKVSAGLGVGVYYQSMPTALNTDASLQTSSATGIGGFSLAVRYAPIDRLALSLVFRNLGLSMTWDIETGDSYWGPTQSQDNPLPEIALGSRFEASLLGRPLIWSADLVGYIWDGEWERLPHAEAVLHNGLEWHAWDIFHIRLGLGDLALNSGMFDSDSEYWEDFSVRVGAGFAWDLRWIRDGMWLNYGLSTDRSGALFDQVLDITLTF